MYPSTYFQIIGPFLENELFNSADWSMLDELESDAYASSLSSLVEDLQVVGLSADDDTSSFRSDLVMKIASLLRSSPKRGSLELPTLLSEHRYPSKCTDTLCRHVHSPSTHTC